MMYFDTENRRFSASYLKGKRRNPIKFPLIHYKRKASKIDLEAFNPDT